MVGDGGWGQDFDDLRSHIRHCVVLTPHNARPLLIVATVAHALSSPSSVMKMAKYRLSLQLGIHAELGTIMLAEFPIC